MCTFDQDLCGWKQMENIDFFDWTRISGLTPSFGTGPSEDHTRGDSKNK